MKKARILFVLALVAGMSQIANAQQSSQREQQRKQDQLQIAVQKICPTTGNKLGTHGKPIKVKIGKEEIFLCCQGCLKGKVNPKHWATIHANFAKAQTKCPVMNKPLPKNPKWTIVKGRIVYVCCPPCTKKIAADPGKYLGKVTQLYTASVRKEQNLQRR